MRQNVERDWVANRFGKFILGWILLVCGVINTTSATAQNRSYVTGAYQRGDFILAQEKRVATVYVDSQDYKGVQRAVANFRTDLFKVAGKSAKVVSDVSALGEYAVIVGSLGKSRLLDQLVAQGKLDISGLRGQWEGFRIEVLHQPFDGVERALVIAGSDKRGAIFGVYDLSEHIGVSPWYWWADVPAKRAESLYIPATTRIQEQPKVRYRGIFLNDEAPALTGWAHEKFGDLNSQFYEHVFELLLRLKANFLWPAMWNNAFNTDDPENRILADEMGIVMSTSHHEPMMRAHKEWAWADKSVKGNQLWDYATNAQALYKFWKAGIEADKPYESITTLGMRGDGDEPMSEGENIDLLEKVVADQREILARVYGGNIEDVEQVWTLYKEVQGYYEKGMRVPDDVTLLWADDNWGNIRRLPTPQERKRSGGAGVYYHFDYVGGPRSYRWINTIPIAKIWEQMNLAYQYEANRIWITNVGDLKPMEYPIDFFLRMAWDPEAWPKEKLNGFGLHWATQQFGAEYAQAVHRLLTGYTRHNGRRKPELMQADTYSQLNYSEAERVSNELQALSVEAETLYRNIPATHKDAFFQLVLYPVKATAIIYEIYNNVSKNRLYARQGRASANTFAEKARAYFAADQALAREYHQLGHGRWNHFMAQPHIGYTHWNNPPANTMPVLHVNAPKAVADMGVAVEGGADSWPITEQLQLDEFNPYGQARRYIDIYNKGTKPFSYKAGQYAPWIKLSRTEGLVTSEERIWVSIDWAKAPKGRTQSAIHIKGTGWGDATVQVSAFHPHSRSVRGFVEADGYVAIEAASGKAKGNTGVGRWEEIPLHGRTQSSMSTFGPPDFSFSDPREAPYLEYELYLFNRGEVEVTAIVAPSLNFVPGRGMRFAVGFDNEQPQVVDILADNSHAAWQESVRAGVRYALSEHRLKEPGAHKLRIYMIDPGVVLQKLLIDTGGLKSSYLGPEQSRYVP